VERARNATSRVATQKARARPARTRIERTAGSPLYRIEAEPPRLLGDNKLARTMRAAASRPATAADEMSWRLDSSSLHCRDR